MVLEIPPNPNCEAVELRVFNDLEPPKPITHVRVEPPRGGAAQWCAVTGWTLQATSGPALARRVDDSGEGVAILVSGGEAGLRLKPERDATPWGLTQPSQWGVPFLLLPDASDLRFAA